MIFLFHIVAIMTATVFIIRGGIMVGGFSTGPSITSTTQARIASSFVSSRYPHYGYPRSPIPSRSPFYLSTHNAGDNADFMATQKKAKLVFLGTPDVAATSLRTLVEHSKQGDSIFEVVSVVTQPPKRRKRRGKEIPSPVGLAAEELNIPVLCPEKASNTIFLDKLEHEIQPDICITAAYGQYLPKRFLAIPSFGTLNIHPSLLPRWRGASPVQRSLQAGDNPVGVSLLFTVSKMDAGPIVSQKVCSIDENDTATIVLPNLFEIGTSCLLDALPDVITRKITIDTAAVQDEELVVNADMIHSSEAELRVWEESAKDCHNKARGFSMWPGTFLYFQLIDEDDNRNSKMNVEPLKVKVITSRVLEEDSEEKTQDVTLGPNKGDGLRIVCGDGSVLELLTIQPATRKPMDAKSFCNGLRGKRIQWVNMEAKQVS